MATYTDTELFQRDFFPTGTDEMFPRLLERAAEIAYHYVNSRLGGTYAVPFAAPTPGEIVAISDMLTKCVVIALQSRRTPVLPKAGAQKRNQVDGDCALAILWLDDLERGRSVLTGVAPRASAQGYHTRAGHTPIFDVDDSVNHVPDPDLLDQIDLERA